MVLDVGDVTTLAAAFPRTLRPDVEAMLATVSPGVWGSHAVSSSTIDSARCRLELQVEGETVVVPYRQYLDSVRPTDPAIGLLTPAQHLALGCLWTRHHNGWTRQRWVRRIVRAEQAWVMPFVVQLLGEYVVEIITDICLALPELADPASPIARRYGRFLSDNPAFLQLTSQRVASYWDCYHRGRHLNRSDYPGYVLLDRLRRATAATR